LAARLWRVFTSAQAKIEEVKARLYLDAWAPDEREHSLDHAGLHWYTRATDEGGKRP
jgi:hypothetical protein